MNPIERLSRFLTHHRNSIWLVFIVAVMVFLSMIAAAQPGVADPNVCYGVADQINNTAADNLLVMNRLPPFTPQHTGTLIGPLGRNSVETAALSIDANTLYAANGTDDTLGSINMATGVWTTIGPMGSAGNPFLGTVAIDDVDSLSVHPLTGDLWGVTHETDAVYLFKINTTTGSVVPDTFGPGYDYVQLDYSTIVGIDNDGNPDGTSAPDESDDLGIHPLTGEFFMIANGSGKDQLVRIEVDGINPPASPLLNTPSNGRIPITTIGLLINIDDGDTPIRDMEGFAFFNDGSFYGTTGDASSPSSYNDRLWLIDPLNGEAQSVGIWDPSGTYHDFEGVGCLTGGANTMSGQVFCEPAPGFNGIFDAGDTVQPGATVRLYRDMNNDGLVDPGDRLIQTTVTDAGGLFSFQVGIAGNFVIELDGVSIPAGSLKTTHPVLPTSPIEEADFVNLGAPFSEYGQNDTNNRFGFTCTPVVDLEADVQISIDPVVVGDTVVYTISVTNNGPGDASNITITDLLPPELTYVSDNGGCLLSGGNTLTCDIASLTSGSSLSIQVIMTATSAGNGTITNTTTVTSGDVDHNPGNNNLTLISTITSSTTGGGPGQGQTPGQDQSSSGAYTIQKMGFAQAKNRVEWVISVSNIGSIAGTNVVVTDTLPAGLRLASVSVPGGSYTESGQTVSVTINTIAPGQTVTFSIFSDIIDASNVTNTACVAGSADGTLACATASIIQTLPATGETPLRRSTNQVLLLVMLGLGMLARRRLMRI